MIKIHHSNDKMDEFCQDFVDDIKSSIDEIETFLENKKNTSTDLKEIEFISWFIEDYIKDDIIFKLKPNKFLKAIYEIDKKIFELFGYDKIYPNYQQIKIKDWEGMISFFLLPFKEYDDVIRELSSVITTLSNRSKPAAKKRYKRLYSANTISEKLDEIKKIRKSKDCDYLDKLKSTHSWTSIEHKIKLVNKEMSDVKEIKKNFFGCKDKNDIVFNYNKKNRDKFIKKLLDNLSINTCLYCNRQPINHYNNKRFGTTLDHFYDKGSYPYFALSFYNLIPSCYSCNSLLKKSKPFCLSTHLHPYDKGFENILHFAVSINDDIDEIIHDESKDFEIKLFDKSTNMNELEKARKNEVDFCLEEQYQIHKPEVRRLLNLNLLYRDLQTAIDSYYIDSPHNIIDEQTFKLILGVFLDEKDLHKETLAKLKMDIIKEYHLSF